MNVMFKGGKVEGPRLRGTLVVRFAASSVTCCRRRAEELGQVLARTRSLRAHQLPREYLG
jgi:hypothetical protein